MPSIRRIWRGTPTPICFCRATTTAAIRLGDPSIFAPRGDPRLSGPAAARRGRARGAPADEAALTATLTRLGLHADRQQLPVLQAAAADARRRLRRAVAAHWRDDVAEDDAIYEILHAPFTGILPHCKWHGKSSAPLCVAAMFVEIGIRDAANDLGMKADGNAAFRCAMMVQFPEIKQRIEEVKRRAVRALVKSPLLQDNPRRARAEQE